MARTPPVPPNNTRGRTRRPSLHVAFALALFAGVLLAACGSSNPSGSSSTANSANSPSSSGSSGSGNGGVTIAYSQCMRSHGVPSFPDPNSQGAIELHASSGGSSSSIDPNSAQYIAAQKACQKLAPGPGTPKQQSQDVAQALKYTQCLRSHGVPDFPDPTVVNGQIEFDGKSGIGRTPQFQSAQNTCQSLLTSGSGS
jgi:hypothetical protein